MGYADVGFHGCKDIPTPNLDALAEAGVRFTNGYVSGPYCTPTRAGLLTGRYQTRFGHEFNPGDAGRPVGLPLTETTIADRLKAAGYATGLVGKWHLGDAAEVPPARSAASTSSSASSAARTPTSPARGAILRGTEPVDEKEYLTDAFGREAVAFIDRHKSEAVLPLPGVQRRPHADAGRPTPRLQKFAVDHRQDSAAPTPR